jgi:Zn-dependent peptidase ImmA (M78 family)/transcriptional regulator with XRE-family HTH domain
MPDYFNPDLLRMARQARGLSQEELREGSGVSQATISKLESGNAEPTEGVLDRLAQALHYPPSLFAQTDRMVGLPLSVHPIYRKRASVGQRALAQLEADMNLRLLHIRRLLRSLDFRAELPLPQMDIDDYEGPEQIADFVRRTWMIPSGPVRNLTEVAERAGCVVVACDFDGRAVDGVTQRVPGLPPCIFLNRNMPADRQRFTLAHEIGHIVMHRTPTPEMEQEANAFAAALLMPERDVRPSLIGGLTLARLGALKLEWRVAMAALAVRAKQVGAVNDYQYRQLWARTLARYRTKEPAQFDFAPEVPSILGAMVAYHANDLKFDGQEFGRLLHLYEDEVRQLYGVGGTAPGVGLRVVR